MAFPRHPILPFLFHSIPLLPMFAKSWLPQGLPYAKTPVWLVTRVRWFAYGNPTSQSLNGYDGLDKRQDTYNDIDRSADAAPTYWSP